MSGSELSAAAARVQRALAERGLPCLARELPASPRSAAEAAAAIGCRVEAGRSPSEGIATLMADLTMPASSFGEGRRVQAFVEGGEPHRLAEVAHSTWLPMGRLQG